MKINWKIFLLFILLLSLIVPVYTSAVETESDTTTELEATENVSEGEGGVEEEVDSVEVLPEVLPEVPIAPQKIEEKTNEDKSEVLTNKNPLKSSEVKKVTAIPSSSTIATVFPDAEMANTIVTSLNSSMYSPTQFRRNWTVNDTVTENDLKTISQIHGDAKKIVSIEGIQYCTQVKEISFRSTGSSSATGLDNFSPLAEAVGGYPNLETFTLSGLGWLQDLTFLSKIDGGFPKLTTLNIRYVDCKDYSFLTKVPGGFPQLKNLIIYVAGFKDLSVLFNIENGLPNLINLDLYGNGLSDISPLASFNELSQLEALDLGNNLIDNLDFLVKSSGVPNLKRLNLGANSIENKALESFPNSLTGFPKLETLYLGQNRISDITSLTQTDFSNLTFFDLKYNQISDISLLANMQFNYSIFISASGQGILLPVINSVPTNQNFATKSIDIIDELGNNRQPNQFLPTTGTYQAIDSQITWPASTMLTDPSYLMYGYVRPYIPARKGVSYGWDYTRNENGRTVSFGGTVYQPLNYIHFPPTITADNSKEYVENETVTEAEFLTDVHAATDDGSAVDSDFETVVNKSVPGDYVVTLTASNNVGAATPVTITVSIMPILELKVPTDFRMDLDANTDAVPISDTKQTLNCYGATGEAKLEVIDRRSAKAGWKLVGSMTPFMNSTGDILESPLKYQSHTLALGSVYLNTTNQPIEKQAASVQAGYITTDFDLQNELTMEILPNDALVNDSYEALVTWTLEDAP